MHIRLCRIGVELRKVIFSSEEALSFPFKRGDISHVRQQDGRFLVFTDDGNSYIFASLWKRRGLKDVWAKVKEKEGHRELST
ncbi:hypothetical protein STEG23_016244, partial [Scotinomys teguina]